MRYEVISADCHIDLCWLPPELFTTNAKSELRDRMPYVTDGAQRPAVDDHARCQPRRGERHGLATFASKL